MIEDIFVFDTNHISSLLRPRYRRLLRRIANDQIHMLILCDPVIYEVEKGLLHKNAERQLFYFRRDVIPLFIVVSIQLPDWRVASVLWAEARRNGRQLADVDLLVAAIALRLNGTLVTSDGDFDYLPTVPTANWLTQD